MSEGPLPRDDAPLVAGDTALQSAVLEDLAGAGNYRTWIVDLVAPWLGTHALEIGSGRGDYCAAWAERGCTVTASEADPGRLRHLRKRFASTAAVSIREIAVPVTETEMADYTAVVAINVLEHIKDDVEALRHFAALIRDGGNVVLFVPAFSFAMSDFDRAIGHYRRYTKRLLRAKLRAAGLDVVVLHYVNSVGLLAWVVVMRLLRRRPQAGPLLTVYDRTAVPVLRRTESWLRPPFGQSLLAVARPVRG